MGNSAAFAMLALKAIRASKQTLSSSRSRSSSSLLPFHFSFLPCMGTHSLGTDIGNLITWVWGAWELYPFCLSSALLLSPFLFPFSFLPCMGTYSLRKFIGNLMTWVWGRWRRTEGSGERAGLRCVRVNRVLKRHERRVLFSV